MFEFIITNLYLILPIVLSSGGALMGIMKWHSKAVKEAYDKGKQEETCLTRIENKADTAVKEVKKIDEKVDASIKKGDEHHDRLYSKLDDYGKILNEVSKDVAFLRGKAST